jgi:hypothetical protein
VTNVVFVTQPLFADGRRDNLADGSFISPISPYSIA